jgi:ferrous iron transport protein B
MWGKGEQYLRKMGGVILIASVIVWVLNYFPLRDSDVSEVPVANVDDSAINPDRDSYLEMAGKFITPVLEPIGFHWRASVAALAGAPAKEIVVSTLGVLYTNDETVSDARLGQRLAAINPATGQPDFTHASALSFMVFVLLYFPCMATVTAIVRETGRLRYGVFSIVYNTVVAWCIAWLVYHAALFFA